MALVDRAQAILLRPRQEWPVIDKEEATVSGLYQSYVVPLAAIGPIASLIGITVFGAGIAGVAGVTRGLTSSVAYAIISWVLTLVGVYVLALVIDYLAPTFGGTRSQIQAFKVAAYSGTAQWLAGIFLLVPALSILTILGLYSVYLLYLGLPVLMRVPQERAIAYIVAIIVVGIVIAIGIGIVVGAVAAALIF